MKDVSNGGTNLDPHSGLVSLFKFEFGSVDLVGGVQYFSPDLFFVLEFVVGNIQVCINRSSQLEYFNFLLNDLDGKEYLVEERNRPNCTTDAFVFFFVQCVACSEKLQCCGEDVYADKQRDVIVEVDAINKPGCYFSFCGQIEIKYFYLAR